MTWQLPDTYHLAGHGRGTATLKFYEGRDILSPEPGVTEGRSGLAKAIRCPGLVTCCEPVRHYRLR